MLGRSTLDVSIPRVASLRARAVLPVGELPCQGSAKARYAAPEQKVGEPPTILDYFIGSAGTMTTAAVPATSTRRRRRRRGGRGREKGSGRGRGRRTRKTKQVEEEAAASKVLLFSVMFLGRFFLKTPPQMGYKGCHKAKRAERDSEKDEDPQHCQSPDTYGC